MPRPPPCSIDDLLDELLVLIFIRLDGTRTWSAVLRVSRRFYRLARDGQVIARYLDLDQKLERYRVGLDAPRTLPRTAPSRSLLFREDGVLFAGGEPGDGLIRVLWRERFVTSVLTGLGGTLSIATSAQVLFAASSSSSEIQQWIKGDGLQMTRGTSLFFAPASEERYLSLLFSDQRLFAGTLSGRVRSWLFVQDSAARSLPLDGSHDGGVLSLAAVGKSFLVSGSHDSTMGLWSLDDQRLVHKATGHSAAVESVEACQERGSWRLASGSRDSTIRLWTLKIASSPTTSLLRVLQGFQGTLKWVATPRGQILFSGAPRVLNVWKENGTAFSLGARTASFTHALAYGPSRFGGLALFAGSQFEDIRVF